MIRLILLSITFSIAVSCVSGPNGIKDGAQLTTPNYELIELKNGIQVYFILDKSLPMFTVQAVLASGSFDDPSDKSGTTSLMASMLKEGSGNLTSSDYKSAYSKYSSHFSVDIDKDTVSFQSTGLSKYDGEITKLFLDTILNPNFMQDRKASKSIRAYDKIRKKRQSEIIKSMERASYFASISFSSLLHNNKGYGLPEWGTAAGLKKTLLSDIKKHYEDFMTPQNLQFALSGNYSEETKNLMLQILKDVHSKKSSNEKNLDSKEPETALISSKIIVVDKPNLKQAEIRIGHFGPKRINNDYIPLYIANSAVGSGDFTTRLMQEVRVNRGLVYGISSWFYGFKNGGTYVVSSSTRHEKITEVIQTSLDVLKKAANNGISKSELNTQRNVLVGQFPLKFETNESYLQQLMRYKTYGFDSNYITTFYNKIKSLKIDEANEVLKKYSTPENVLIVIFASKKMLPKDFKNLKMPVEYINYQKVFN